MRTPAVHLSCVCLLVVLLCAGCRPDRQHTEAPPRTWTEASTGMVFVRIDPGSFTMGSPSGEVGREAQERQHSVSLSRTFWMGRTEVTQASPLEVIRGGSWYFEADSARCALRYTHHPKDLGFSLGFPVVREGD